MGDTVEFHGAYLVQSEPRTWRLLENLLSDDQERLAQVFEVENQGFRVTRCKKSSGKPQWIGLWWSEAESSSIAGNIDDAMRLAREYIR